MGSPIASSLKPSIEVTCPNMAKHGYLHHGQKYDKDTVSHRFTKHNFITCHCVPVMPARSNLFSVPVQLFVSVEVQPLWLHVHTVL